MTGPFVVVLWFLSTLLFNYASILLINTVKGGPLEPNDITVLEIGLCSIFAYANLKRSRLSPLPPSDAVLPLILICSANALSCRLFLIALSTTVPLSLLQTLRASQPLFVVISQLVLGILQDGTLVFCTLPILFGFSMAASTEYGDIELSSGLLCALVSAVSLTVVNLLTKRALLNNKLTALQIQFMTVTGSFFILIPFWLADDGVSRTTAVITGAGGPEFLKILLLNSVSYQMANACTFSNINSFPPLTFSVIDTVRRLCVVVGGFVAQGNLATRTNKIGIALVLSGAIVYSYFENRNKKKIKKETKKD